MASSRLPWTRILVFVVLLAALAWWLHYRDRGVAEEESGPGPADGVGRPAAVDDRVVVDVLAYEVAEGEAPAFWIRVGNVAWDVELSAAEASEADRERLERRRRRVLEDLQEELSDLRRELENEELKGEIRRAASVPAWLYTQVFQAFIEAGYGAVDMVLTEGRPPGPPPR